MRKSTLFILTLSLLLGLAYAAPAADKGPIKIGFYADLSGGTAQWGNDALKGAQMRVKDINEKGGILGRPVELVSYDCKTSPTEAIKAYSRLVQQDGVVAVMGSLLSNTGLAVGPVAEQLKVPVVVRCMDERVTTPQFDPEDPEKEVAVNPYMFLLQPSAFQQSFMIAGYAIDKLGMNSFASLYSPANAYALYLAKGFEYYVKKRGKKFVGGFEFQQGDKDYKSQLTKMKPLNPDGLYLCNYVPENANAVKQARELGLTVRFLGNNSWYKPMDKVAGAAADGGYFPNNVSMDDPSLKWFFEKYQKEHGEEPRLHSFSGWDDIGFIAFVVEKSKSTDPQTVAKAMESVTNFKGIIDDINMNPKTHRPEGLKMSILYFEGDQIKTAELKYLPKEP
jgi:branched-chain amino acid transport system substrate-binding protein